MVKMENIQKHFNGHQVLKGISLKVKPGEVAAIIGPSGSGKTTLIRTINGFVVPDAGKVLVGGQEINYRDRELLRRTRKKIGMVYQLFNLVERTSVLENVLSGALGRLDRGFYLFSSILGFFTRREREMSMELLSFVHLEDKAYERVDCLSGGQKQRVAIARALMQQPELLLADEPIANLDVRTSRKIMELLLRINAEKGITLLTVLHHLESVKEYCPRVIGVKDGAISFDGAAQGLDKNLLREIYAFDEEDRCWAA
ncbi:MAG: phosphonate ABC transporter ATP-binding protein [Thermodesulfobacteriota bacterium]